MVEIEEKAEDGRNFSPGRRTHSPWTVLPEKAGVSLLVHIPSAIGGMTGDHFFPS